MSGFINNVPRELLESCQKRLYSMMQADLSDKILIILSEDQSNHTEHPLEMVELLELIKEMVDVYERRGIILTIHMEQMTELLNKNKDRV